ncbi:hypothetical protein [Thermogutta sp.]|uniref:hypothetical protein n=1 Tax=Thermogutta sp. TaxID=1962930 RepID=UPI00321FB4B2
MSDTHKVALSDGITVYQVERDGKIILYEDFTYASCTVDPDGIEDAARALIEQAKADLEHPGSSFAAQEAAIDNMEFTDHPDYVSDRAVSARTLITVHSVSGQAAEWLGQVSSSIVTAALEIFTTKSFTREAVGRLVRSVCPPFPAWSIDFIASQLMLWKSHKYLFPRVPIAFRAAEVHYGVAGGELMVELPGAPGPLLLCPLLTPRPLRFTIWWLVTGGRLIPHATVHFARAGTGAPILRDGSALWELVAALLQKEHRALGLEQPGLRDLANIITVLSNTPIDYRDAIKMLKQKEMRK